MALQVILSQILTADAIHKENSKMQVTEDCGKDNGEFGSRRGRVRRRQGGG